MTESTAAQEQCYALVETYLRQAFGELAEPHETGAIHVGLGRGIWVGVQPIGDELAEVTVYCWVGRGIPITEEVTKFLLEQNNLLRFGTFGLDSDSDIIFKHSFFGDGLTKAGLARVVRWLADSAVEAEDELTMRFR